MDFGDLPLSQDDRQRVARAIRTRIYQKGETIFNSGDVCTDVYLVRSGLVKLSYCTFHGKELIKSFISEGGLFGSLTSQLTGQGATYGAFALEPVKIDALNHALLGELGRNNLELQQVLLGFFQQLALSKEVREYELLCLSAQERYQRFCEQNQSILARIHQADLALHLGVTPVALSRLKRRKEALQTR